MRAINHRGIEFHVVIASIVLLSCARAMEAPESPERPRPLQAKARVYFVPVGRFPQAALEQLPAYFKSKKGLAIEVLPTIPIDRTAFDSNRRQLIAEELIGLMMRGYPSLARDPDSILVGLTVGDMYIRAKPEWRYAFAAGDTVRFAVVSSARMDPMNYRQPPDAERLGLRLRKMVSKYIGYMYFQLPSNSDRRSVMYSPILSVDDLDSIGEDY